ncbi:MAG: hypothetical protein HN498_04780 [Flavobacteriales bacterium]|jgi:hypothetical protein|nr:hypothetical protein [Flavobacteriales bacterium]MBT6965790.1 hypothetical protein [Flavobacteriales bacterium]
MFKLNRWVVSFLLIGSVFFFVSCEKDVVETITSNDGVQARLAYTEKGYTEIEVNPIVKITCYFSNWDKDVMTPVSGLFDYYDTDDNWVASIDFGDGTCDEWATKTWDVDVFPDYPSGTNDFSVFDYKDKN